MSETDTSTEPETSTEAAPTAPAIVLVEPQLGENIGTAARAMANFGLTDLRIVAPRDGWPNEKAVAAASRADHVIDAVKVFDTVEEAIADLTLVYATTARPRDMLKPVRGPEEAAETMVRSAAAGGAPGILFGRERWGLNNDEVALADEIVTYPVDPKFSSLNIAQAVLLIAYEWKKAAFEAGPLPGEEEFVAARKEDLIGFFDHLERALEETGYFFPPQMRGNMVRNLRSMFHKAQLTEQEVRTLRGVVASFEKHAARVRQRSDRGSDD